MSDGALKSWLRRERGSPRLAFLLQVGGRMTSGLLGLLWTRLLLAAMGRPLFGLFSSFQSLAALGGLGDLGLGGSVAIQVGRYLGRGEEAQLRIFLAGARAAFLLLALLMGLLFLALSPWLPGWLKFSAMPGAGSLTSLFMVGSAAIALLVLSSYVSNLSYACGNVLWPVLPGLLLSQGALFAQWLLARQHAPLSLQFVPYVVAAAFSLGLVWSFIRLSHPVLAEFLPLRLNWGVMGGLAERSFWVYLCGLGNLIYTTTDRLLINAAFGPAEVPRYQQNNKLCELVFFVVVAASFVSTPKIAQWLASPAADDRARATAEASRLSQFQTFVGCAAAFGYLFVNDAFMRVWLGTELQAPLWWQAAFAANLAVTASGDVPLQLSLRLSDRGLRLAGRMVAITALLNLGLSFVSMKLGSIGGIALATVLAQTFLSLALSRFACRELGVPWLPWMLETCMLPLSLLAVATALRFWLPMDSWRNVALLAGAYAALLFTASRLIGFNAAFVRDEILRLWMIFKK